VWPGAAKQASPAAKDIWTERIGPVAETLSGIDHLVVMPSGAMLGVPVEALADGDGVFVGERFVVSYAPSATIYTWLHEQSGESTKGGRMLLVGDPPFTEVHLASMNGADDGAMATAAASDVTSVTLRSALAGNKDDLASLPRVAASRDEVTGISEMTREPTILLGPDASEQKLVELAESGALRDYAAIHLATHALVDDNRPELSALILCQVDLPDPLQSVMNGERIYDGLVTAKEIVREWELDADLVTLSACRTGLGRVVAGEGYVGFSQAFFQAGARSLLVSLWDVDDRATSLLMQRFYKNYYEDKKSKADALQDAKRWLRGYKDDSGAAIFGHPYYWSAFVLIGESE
jgi:CHAT domain-containing protein